ncbi:hypothetical protein ACFL7E_02210 [Thermodesulfobacteriota bacterium]
MNDKKPIWDKIKEEFNKQPISFLGGMASIVALINVILSAHIFISPKFIPFSIDISFLAGLGVFLILEGSLASLFGRVFLVLREMGPGYPFIIAWVNGLISAWVSSFNCFWIFVVNADTVENANGLYLLFVIVAWAIAIYFIHFHFETKKDREVVNPSKKYSGLLDFQIKQKYESDFWVSLAIQTTMFFVAGINIGLKITPFFNEIRKSIGS